MASSASRLESKVEVTEVLSSPFLGIFHNGLPQIQRLIYDYSSDVRNTEWLNKPLTLFGISLLKQQILALAIYAAPLDQIEAFVRKAHANKETRLQNTLEQAILIAVIGLDRTITNIVKKTVLIQGMAETLLSLYAELYPREDYLRILDKANLASPPYTPEDKKREDSNRAALDAVMRAFRKNDEANIIAAITAYRNFLAATETEIKADTNRYNVNIIHHVQAAFGKLCNDGRGLPKVGTEPSGGHDGALADKFCINVIGGEIQRKLPPRVQQLAKRGLKCVLDGFRSDERVIDIDASEFLGNPADTNDILGGKFYYGDDGRATARDVRPSGGGFARTCFLQFLDGMYLSIPAVPTPDKKESNVINAASTSPSSNERVPLPSFSGSIGLFSPPGGPILPSSTAAVPNPITPGGPGY
jgi:hypothetical protein